MRYEEYIDKQIQATRHMVKAVDIMTALIVMTVGVLGFLLTAAAVEHWLVPGGYNVGVRLLLFATLLAGVGYYAAHRLWPLCIGKINPAYAAQAIEHDNPSLKNSLLNLLLFRQHRETITDAVYETLEEQAAQRLTRVPVESAVDRTRLLRLGYVLMAIVAAVALYKIFSPKDPFVTAKRVLMPWAHVVPASRVSIDNVEPGKTTIARGEVLTISADVRGIGADDPIIIRYTTADGQAVDRPVPMTTSSTGLRFTGRIPPATDGAKAGLAQNLRYRIEAGDARSLNYVVTVVAAPTITVERIDYDYPDYTGFVDRSIDRLGDIRAIEGTKVTIHAQANQLIEEAEIDFEADGRREIVLNVSGSEAHAAFELKLRKDRQTPKFTSYVLRFTTSDGRPNRDPVKFPIDVLPDYAPEVALLAPAERIRDVRLDETVAIEVDARDPDFALAEVRLHGEVAGRPVLNVKLLDEDHTGRFTGKHQFTPSEHQLKPGDMVCYWAIARDHRPNEATTDSQVLRITSPNPDQPPEDRIAQREQREPQQGQEGGEPASAGGQSGQNNSPDSTAPSDQPQDQGTDKNAGEHSSDQSTGSQSNESQSGNEQNGSSQSSTDDQNHDSGDSQQQPSGAASNASEADRNRGDSATGGHDRETSSNGNQSSKAQPQSSEESSPVSPEGDNDGEAFDRIQDFLQREGHFPETGDQSQQSDASTSQADESASADGQKIPDRTSDGKPTEEQSSNSDSPTDKPDQTNFDSSTDAGSNANSDREKTTRETRPGEPQKGKQEHPGEPFDQDDPSAAPDGQQLPNQGEPKAGDQVPEGQAPPDSPPNTKPSDKWNQKPSGEKPGQSREPPVESRNQRKSDTPGEQGGDRTGGGEEGGGQKSNRDGTGSSGQNQSADEGAGESSEQGAGKNSTDAGEDATSSERTGSGGTENPGSGSTQREGTGDTEPGEPASAGGPQPQDPTHQQGNESNQRQQPSNQPGESPTDQQNQPDDKNSSDTGKSFSDAAGRATDSTSPPTPSTGTAPAGDAANLEYARKQTDLVLEKLDDQLKRKQLDRRLLDELGWSEADLQRFLARWQQLKAAARDDTPAADAAQRELDDALRSLGLRRGELKKTRVTDDDYRDLRQGYRGSVPLEYQERLRAYNQGISRTRQQDE